MSDYDENTFDERLASYSSSREWKRKSLRFLRYLSTRKMECWGFFVAGFLVATIF